MKYRGIGDFSNAGQLIMPQYANAAAFPTASGAKSSISFADDTDLLHYSTGAAWVQLANFANDLAALENLASTGIAVRTTTNTWAQRSIQNSIDPASTASVTITNGDGVAGNPQVNVNTSNSSTKLAVFVATTANITLSGLQTIDGVALGGDERVLVKNQSTASQNGLYVSASGAWTRATDYNTDSEAALGTLIYVQYGTANGGNWYKQDTAGSIALGTDSLAYSEVFGAAGGTPGGSDGQVQYNNGGAFGGAAEIRYDDGNGNTGFGTNANASYRIYVNGAMRSLGATVASGSGAVTGLTAASMHLQNTSGSETWYFGSRDDDGLDVYSTTLSEVFRIYPGSGRFNHNYAFSLPAVITPSSIGANQNNYALGDSDQAVHARITASGEFDITGLAGGAAGRIVAFTNIGSNAISFIHESASSTTVNRFSIGTGFTLEANESALFYYDGASLRWRCWGKNVTVASGGGTPAGATGQVQFNNAGAFGANSVFFWDNTNTRLGVGAGAPAYTLDVNATDAIRIPAGTTGQRPTTATGLIRHNTSNAVFEYYDGSAWRSVRHDGNTPSGLGTTNYVTYYTAAGTISGDIDFQHNGTVVSIGQAVNASNRLSITGTGASSSTYGLAVHSSAGNTNTLMVRDDSRVGILTNAPIMSLDVQGKGTFGTSSANTTRASRALNLIDANGVMRIWRYTSTTSNSPSFELIWGNTGDTATTAGNYYWDFFINAASSAAEAFVVRKRTAGTDQNMMVWNKDNYQLVGPYVGNSVGRGAFYQAAGQVSTAGDAQVVYWNLYRSSTSTAYDVMLDGTSAYPDLDTLSATNRVWGISMLVTTTVTARTSGTPVVGDVNVQEIFGYIKKVGGVYTASTLTNIATLGDANLSAVAVTWTAAAGQLAINISRPAGTATYRTVVSVRMCDLGS
jgi:hypothetical protein